MMEFLVLEFHYHTVDNVVDGSLTYNAFIALHCSIVEHTPIRSVVQVIYFCANPEVDGCDMFTFRWVLV